MSEPPALVEEHEFLSSILNKNLRIHITDGRMFLGSFKCTDSDRNIVLSKTFEYRLPDISTVPSQTEIERCAALGKSATREMSSRYLGLVVVPGEFIMKIEVEEFVNQIKKD